MAASNRGRPETQGDLSPGEHLRREIDQVAVRKATRVSRQTINNIVNDRQPISRAMSAKLARLMGHSSDYWLRKSYPRQAGNRDQAASSFARKNGVLVNHQIVRAVKDGVLALSPLRRRTSGWRQSISRSATRCSPATGKPPMSAAGRPFSSSRAAPYKRGQESGSVFRMTMSAASA